MCETAPVLFPLAMGPRRTLTFLRLARQEASTGPAGANVRILIGAPIFAFLTVRLELWRLTEGFDLNAVCGLQDYLNALLLLCCWLIKFPERHLEFDQLCERAVLSSLVGCVDALTEFLVRCIK